MTCQPWCTSHVENVCRTWTEDEVTLTWAPGEPVTVWVDDYHEDHGLSLERAERVAWSLLAMVHAARNASTVGGGQ
ncbi:hypothetical protein AB0M95_01940 [Sphaerisporangium sp. NPDC051017]|uniref:hypothetical protein n=1 Tax=Sphaerisporangium sp. NPDC051017 TaxID=3154636 RepID=UPI003428544D